MEFMFITVGLQMAWWSSVLPYLSSKRQRLLPLPIPRVFGWAGFVAGMVITCWLLTRVHHPTSAIIYGLSVIMVSWMLLVLGISHSEHKFPVLIWGTGFALLTAVLG